MGYAGPTSLNINWQAPDGKVTSYGVEVDNTYYNETKETKMKIDGLASDGAYPISVYSKSGNKNSSRVSSTFSTCKFFFYYSLILKSFYHL